MTFQFDRSAAFIHLLTPNPPADRETVTVLRSPETEHDSPLNALGTSLSPAQSRVDILVWNLIAGLIIIGTLWASHAYWVPANARADQNGYLVGGRLLAEHLSSGYQPADPFAFVGRMWILARNGQLFPKYPVGLSALFAIAFNLGGTTHGVTFAYWVSPICSVLALIGSFVLMRAVAGGFAAVLGLLAVATSPIFMGHINNPNSHAATLCAVTWGMTALFSWAKRGGAIRAGCAGALLGIAVTIRYSEGVLLLTLLLAIALFLRRRWRDPQWRIESGLLIAAWALPVLLLSVYNLRSFGDLTGYDSTNESTGFALSYVYANWETMLRQLYNTGLFALFPLALAGLVLMFWRNWRLATLLACWILSTVALYTAYYWAPDGAWLGYARFFLSVLPPLALCAVWYLTQENALGGRAMTARTVVAGVLVAIGTSVNLHSGIPDVEADAQYDTMIKRAGDCVLAHVPPGSLVFGEDRLLHHLQFVGDYRLYGNYTFTRTSVEALVETDPNEPQGIQPERAHALYEKMKNWSDADLVARQNTLMLDALKKGEHVFAMLPKPLMSTFRARYCRSDVFATRVVDTLDEPAESRQERLRRWMGFSQPMAPVPSVTTSGTWQVVEIVQAPT